MRNLAFLRISSAALDGYRRCLIYTVIIVLVGLGLCIGLFVVLVAFPDAPLAGAFTNGCSLSNVQKIQSVGRFKLPPSARLIDTFCEGLQGWVATAKFEMSPQDVNALTTNSLIAVPLSATSIPSDWTSYLRDLVGNTQIASSLYGKYDGRNLLQEILIDTSDPTKYTVYVSVLGG